MNKVPNQKKVLVVDDERSIRMLLTVQLENLGYAPIAVSSGQEALELLAQQEFDIVALDARMPGMSGLAVLRQIRSIDTHTCVVIVTALVDDPFAGEAAELGVDDYIRKPCSQELLGLRLQEALNRRAQVVQA